MLGIMEANMETPGFEQGLKIDGYILEEII